MYIYQNFLCMGFEELNYHFCSSDLKGYRARFLVGEEKRPVNGLYFSGNKLCKI